MCRDGRTYAGIATDVAARFAAHSSGKGAKFTRSNPPVRVLGAQAFASKSEALKAEAALKKLDRTEKLAWARRKVFESPDVDPDASSGVLYEEIGRDRIVVGDHRADVHRDGRLGRIRFRSANLVD